MNRERVAAMTQDVGPTVSLINANRPDLALQVLDSRIPLIQQMGGDPTDTINLRSAIAEGSPDVVPQLTAFLTAAGKMPKVGAAGAPRKTSDGGMAVYDPVTNSMKPVDTGGMNFNTPTESGAVTPSSRQKEWDQYQMLLQTDPAAAKSFGMSAGFVGGEGSELSVHLQKRLSAATDAAQEARTNAAQFSVLANEFEKSDIGAGYFGSTWTEKMKEFSGTQDADSLLRKRYLALRSSQVVKNLPPGAASDADIAMALEGWPPANAKKEMVAQFMRGMAKLESYQDTFETYKAGYISDKGTERGLLETWRAETGKPVAPVAAPTQRKGGTLMMDAAGNQAYVYPDGTVEEVR